VGERRAGGGGKRAHERGLLACFPNDHGMIRQVMSLLAPQSAARR
jgi:hypothetical protein